jgi:hypothetical protein
VDSLQVGSDFRLAAHSSPLVRYLLMDDKGGEVWRIKAYLCVCVCAILRVDVESRCDMYLEIILYHLALYDISCMDDGCMDILIWICLDILVSSCKIISISFVLRICTDLRTLVLNAIGCIYHVLNT